jgi:isoquinoline 1-oxidoreductase beta subunit
VVALSVEPTRIMQLASRDRLAIISRREFLHATVTIGGGLALAVRLPAQETAALATATPSSPRTPAAFVQIANDDTITIITPAVEMGQGGHTSMPMMIMEELGGDWQRLQVTDAAAAAIYNNPMFGQQSTVGSFSVRGWFMDLRRIGAAAREMLVQAAAGEWRVPATECTVAQSRIVHARSGRTRTFGSVAAIAAQLPVPQQPVLKNVADFKLIGSSPPRVDVPIKVDGSARYGIDMVLPGMLYAAVKTCPTFGGTLKSHDDSAARRLSGYHSTVILPDGVIAVARSYWRAKKALDQITVDYDLGPLATLDSARVSQLLHEGFSEPGTVARNDGDVPAAMGHAAKVLEAEYEVPYLAHACMEPMNCTARIDDSGCEVWCGTQTPQAAQAAAAAVLGIPPQQVKVNTMLLGGGFGRRGEADFVTQAVSAAKATGHPVKLIWSREEDIQHDFYRPAAAIRFRAGLDSAGNPTALDCNVVTSSMPEFHLPGPVFYTGGVVDTNYSIPNLRVTGVNKDIGIRFGFWRSVNDSHNPFMLESFIDELAHQSGKDPYRFRRALLQHAAAARQLAVLDLLAEKAGWDRPQPGHYLGISAFQAFGSYIGTVVDISAKGNAVTLHRVVTAIDCGVAIHPDNIRAQLEGGMVFGLAAVLRGEITIDKGAVKQSNFHDYPMLSMTEMPRVDCFVLASDAAPGGVGEPGTAPIAPALANAIFAATGTRHALAAACRRQNFTFSAARS